jgi:glycosyltransferase involved in cell wall biosynthesis
MTSVVVIVPCYEPHFKFIPTLLQNIANSTRKPDRIAISCSSWLCDTTLRIVVDTIPVDIYFHSRAMNAAENRNHAARLATEHIFTFFDADDLMYPERIEYVCETLGRGADVALHAYSRSQTYDPNYQFPSAGRLQVSLSSIVVDPNPYTWGVACDPPNGVPFTHGHVTLWRNVFSNFQFDESAENRRVEDAMYCRQLVGWYNCVCIENALSHYTFPH